MIRIAAATLALWALLIVLCLLASSAQASVIDPLAVANKAWPGSPCAGKLRMTFDATLSLAGEAGNAIGVLVGDDGSYTTQSCDFAVDPAYWGKATPRERCQIAAHEAGHLAGLHHSLTGVMREDHSGWYAPCASLRDRIEHALVQRTGAADYNIVCGKQSGAVLYCKTFLTSHVARFRVRVAGDAFTFVRVRVSR